MKLLTLILSLASVGVAHAQTPKPAIVLVHGFASNAQVNWAYPGWVATVDGTVIATFSGPLLLFSSTPQEAALLAEVEELDETARGAGGFGSTGR